LRELAIQITENAEKILSAKDAKDAKKNRLMPGRAQAERHVSLLTGNHQALELNLPVSQRTIPKQFELKFHSISFTVFRVFCVFCGFNSLALALKFYDLVEAPKPTVPVDSRVERFETDLKWAALCL
jgi:hypothetical protein